MLTKFIEIRFGKLMKIFDLALLAKVLELFEIGSIFP